MEQKSKQKIGLSSLLQESNRGLLLDVTVFVLNLFLMRELGRRFVALLQDAAAGEPAARFVAFLIVLGLFFLPPLGATIKRWHYHQRLRAGGQVSERLEDPVSGCLFHPLLYFCLNVVIFAVINAFILDYVYEGREPEAAVFVSSLFIGLALILANTFLVYRYFSPPKREPQARILREPRFEILGDVALFTNMLIFQLFWNLLGLAEISRVGSVSELVGRILVFGFIALLVYFPPRLFYLAEDVKKPRTWLTMLLANAPIIYRFVIGRGPSLSQ